MLGKALPSLSDLPEVSISTLGPLPVDAYDLPPEEVRARLRRARERGQPLFPWEEVTPATWRQSLEAIQTAVREVLRAAAEGAGDPGADRFPAKLAGPAGARALGVAAFTSGTGPLLGRWIEAGLLDADLEAARILRLHLTQGRLRAVRLEAAFQRVVDCLSGVGVVPTVVKGFHTAHAVFPEPGTRPASDLDLVVDQEHLAAAEGALGGAGFVPRQVLARPYTCEWTPAGQESLPRSLDLTHEANPWSVDLHASFDRDFGGVRTVSIVTSTVEATRAWHVAGRTVRVLAQPYLTAYLALHASQELKNLTLLRLIELVRVMRGSEGGALDWSALLDVLGRARATAYVHPAMELAERLAPGTVPEDVRSWVARAAPERVRGVVGRLEPASAQRLEAVSLEESFMWAVGPIEHVRRLGRVLWPIWAGSPANVLRVQATRARQLVARRVAVGGARESGPPAERSGAARGDPTSG